MKKGFTLIELLVVIAIIGILSSIVLVSLNQARQRGRDSSAQASMSSIRAAAEIYYSNNSGYDGFCDDSSFTDLKTAVESQVPDESEVLCGNSSNEWAAEVELNTEDVFFCVDHTGFAGVAAGTERIEDDSTTECDRD